MNGPLWITYAWSDNAEGDFDFLVQELSRAEISAKYDKIALVPGRKLWTQIADRIASDPLSGWAYLVTPNSLASVACQEELAYALQRALETKGEEFPLIGLLHGVSVRDVPLPLRVRLCVNLANPDWIEEIRAALSGAAPRRSIPEQNPFVVKIHRGYLGQADRLAIEIRPRFGELRYWRWAFPSSGPQPIAWGTGPANGGGIGGTKREVIEGEFSDIAGTPMKFVMVGSGLAFCLKRQGLTPGGALERHGEGVQHLAFNCSGAIYEERLRRFAELGYEVIQSGVWVGKARFHYFATEPDAKVIYEVFSIPDGFLLPEPEAWIPGPPPA